MSAKIVAISTGPSTYLDHLGVLSYIMGMPLYVTEEDTYHAAKTFYPQFNVHLKSFNELSAFSLAEEFDAIFETDKFFALELKPILEIFCKKKMRFVYCPHGNSDKGQIKLPVFQDVSLVYGNHMVDLLTLTKAVKKTNTLVRTGNYRLLFYRKYRDFYDSLMKEFTKNKLDPAKKTILYAPSWEDGESPSSFFKETDRVIENLSKDFNLIVKLHPFLKRIHLAQTESVVQKYKGREEILLLEEFPTIYPLLNICDLYIGDYSSMGYDFLTFDRPLYFFRDETPSFSAIHSCGLCIPKKENINSFIKKTFEKNQVEKSAIRKSVYHYSFGEEISFDFLKEQILSCLQKKEELQDA